jgi:hypothetical protein
MTLMRVWATANAAFLPAPGLVRPPKRGLGSGEERRSIVMRLARVSRFVVGEVAAGATALPLSGRPTVTPV